MGQSRISASTADPRAAQPAVPPGDAPGGLFVEDVVDVHEDGETVRRRAERPHQVADAIDVPALACHPGPAKLM